MSGMVLMDWSARGPGMDSRKAFLEWWQRDRLPASDGTCRPACDTVSPALRRRLSNMTRCVLEPFLEVCQRNAVSTDLPAMVFASANGEIAVLETLLRQMFLTETLSPIDFCNSVHHTATGYLSMVTENRGISRTVSAGAGTFAAGLMEVFLLLSTGRATRVALLVADEPVPGLFGDSSGVPSFPFGMAALFRPATEEDRGLAVLTSSDLEAMYRAGTDVFAFLRGMRGVPDNPGRPPVNELLFHAPPMVLLDRYVDDLPEGVVCEVDIRPGIPFATSAGVPAYVGVEYMAQTIGVYAGVVHRKRGRTPEIGFLIGSRCVDIQCDFFSIGQVLRITAQRMWDGGRVIQFDCAVRDAITGTSLLQANLSAYSPGREDETE